MSGWFGGIGVALIVIPIWFLIAAAVIMFDPIEEEDRRFGARVFLASLLVVTTWPLWPLYFAAAVVFFVGRAVGYAFPGLGDRVRGAVAWLQPRKPAEPEPGAVQDEVRPRAGWERLP